MGRQKIQFQVRAGWLIFLFGLFCVGDGFAQTAGMLAVKGHGHRLAERSSLEIVRKHRRPGDRLEKRPVRAEGGDERENDQNFAKP